MKYNDDERYNDKLDVDPWDYDSQKYKEAKKKQQKNTAQNYYDSSRYNQHVEEHMRHDGNSGHTYSNNENPQPQRYVEDYTSGWQDFGRKSNIGADPSKQAIISLIFGIMSVLGVFFGFISAVISIIGFVFGIKALKALNGSKGSARTMAIIGIVLCCICWVEYLIGICLFVFANIFYMSDIWYM